MRLLFIKDRDINRFEFRRGNRKKDWILEYDEYISKLSIYKEKIEEKLNEDFDDWVLLKSG